jgi:hypothetical protein
VSAFRVVVIDDDLWKRAAIAEQLDAHDDVTVVHALDQDEAATWPTERWGDVDGALVDVFDDRAPGEVGTDLYSGITAVANIAPRCGRVIAISPQCAHPLVQLRLSQAGPDFVYHRWEVPTLELLVAALLMPAADHRLAPPSPADLEPYGATSLRANAVIAEYLASPLDGRLLPDIGLRELGLPRRTVDAFRRKAHGLGMRSTEALSTADRAVRLPRWPDVRDNVLRLLGRLDAAPTEFDKPWW